jgi:Acetyltransferase (GNAT) domain
MPAPSSFILRPATEEDVPEMVEVYFDAWADNIVAQTCFPPSSPQSQEFWINGFTDELQEKHAHMLVVMDTTKTPAVMVGFAKWNSPFTAGEAHTSMPPREIWPTDGNVDKAVEFFTLLFDKHEEMMGNRPHWYLEMISSRRAYQGQGGGGMLIRWGVEKADADKVECFLDATPDGKPVYERYGFKTLQSVACFAEGYEHCFMLRGVNEEN